MEGEGNIYPCVWQRLKSGYRIVVGDSYRREIIVSSKILDRLKRVPGIKGITTSQLPLLGDDEIDWNPKVKALKKRDFLVS
jgi:hypothetical protein